MPSDPRKQNVFKTKHLNVWVAAASPWLNLLQPAASRRPPLTLDTRAWDGCTVASTSPASKTSPARDVVLDRDGDGRALLRLTRNYVPEAMR
jgi:hypothetical protein